MKIMEDLIDNYLYVFDVSTLERIAGVRVVKTKQSVILLFQIDEEHQTQIELEVKLITTWKDTQVHGDIYSRSSEDSDRKGWTNV